MPGECSAYKGIQVNTATHASECRKSEGFPASGILRFFLYIVCRMDKYIVCRVNKYMVCRVNKYMVCRALIVCRGQK